MHRLITFESDRFDLLSEDPHPINDPTHGQSIGQWLLPRLAAEGVDVSELDAEDWGWYAGARYGERDYLVGFVGHPPEEPGERPELIIQVDKMRSLKEKLLGREKIDEADPLVEMIVSHVRSIDDVENLSVEWTG